MRVHLIDKNCRPEASFESSSVDLSIFRDFEISVQRLTESLVDRLAELVSLAKLF